VTYRDPPRVPIEDPVFQQALDEVRRALMELARDNVSRDISVTLPNATPVVVRHGLGRAMKNYAPSFPTGAVTTGRIDESHRTADSVTLTASGFGATISISLRFW